jgi:hypothetical protein
MDLATVIQVLTQAVENNEMVHCLPASDVLSRLQSSMALSAKLEQEQKINLGQGGREKYFALPPVK